MLKHGSPYYELGAAYLNQREREHATRRYVKQLERLGHRVIFEPAVYQRRHEAGSRQPPAACLW